MKLNGKEYKMPELDFNAVCQLEELGIDLVGKMQSRSPRCVRLLRWQLATQRKQARNWKHTLRAGQPERRHAG